MTEIIGFFEARKFMEHAHGLEMTEMIRMTGITGSLKPDKIHGTLRLGGMTEMTRMTDFSRRRDSRPAKDMVFGNPGMVGWVQAHAASPQGCEVWVADSTAVLQVPAIIYSSTTTHPRLEEVGNKLLWKASGALLDLEGGTRDGHSKDFDTKQCALC